MSIGKDEDKGHEKLCFVCGGWCVHGPLPKNLNLTGAIQPVPVGQ